MHRSWLKAVIGIGFFLGMAACLDVLFPPPIERANNYSPLIVDRQGRWVHAFTNNESRWRFSANLQSTDPVFVDRLVAIEDKRFFKHPGVDAAAVVRAGFDAIRKQKITSGASTITMQTARLLEPRPRTFSSKLVEMIRAVQIERRLSKDEILSIYLTLTPYGGNLEGVRAASLAYFGKEPDRLTDSEQALLIALPQAPEARRPDRRPRAASEARKAILQKLSALGFLSPSHAEEAASSVLPTQRQSFPRAAYHAAREASLKSSADNGVFPVTLDIHLQREMERLAQAYARQQDDQTTVSLLVVDHQEMAVRASVGSASLDRPGGWIDLTKAVRSPGSTLKPLIYALAFEDGIAGPDTIIEDMPRNFGDYRPENFDRTFRGEVRIREALQHSLNIPAVTALDRLGADRFSSILKAAGVSLQGARGADRKPGLAIALGGAGITARDIAVLYAGLANGGQVRPLEWTSAEPEATERKGYRLFSETSARKVSSILMSAPSLAGRAPTLLSASAPRIAFKTGTSYGYRDAWAAGHAGRYTAVVWVGRADGAPRPGMTGRKAAAPLLFDVFDAIARWDANGDTSVPAFEEDAPNKNRENVLTFSHAQSPEIVFPKDGIELFVSKRDLSRGVSLSARGGGEAIAWYVNGVPIVKEGAAERYLWRPDRSGFFEIVVVNGLGQSAKAKVRVQLMG